MQFKNILDKNKKQIESFLNQGNERSLKTKKNIIASFFIKGFSLLTSLLVVPLTIDYLDKTKYGIWLTLSSVLAWISFFDVGIGNGLRNKFAIAKARGEIKKARIYVSTSYALMLIIIVPVTLLFLSINHTLNWPKILNATADMSSELSFLAAVVLVFTSLQFIVKVISYILLADQRPAVNDLLSLISSIFIIVSIYFLTKITDGSMLYIGAVFSGFPFLVMMIASVVFFKKSYKYYRPAVEYVEFGFSRDLLGLGFKFFILQIAGLVVFQSANIIIAQILGPEYVSEFNIAYKYFSIPLMAFIIILTPIWSAFTDAYTSNDKSWMINVLKKLKKIALLFTVSIIFMLIISQFIYNIWIGDSIKISFSTSLFMTIYIILFIWMSLYVYLINGIGTIKLSMYLSFIEIIGNIALAIFLGKYFGLIGILVSMALFVALKGILIYIQVNKVLNDNAIGIWGK